METQFYALPTSFAEVLICDVVFFPILSVIGVVCLFS